MLVIMIPVMMMKMTVTMMMVPEEECARSHNKFLYAVFQSFMFGNEKFMYQNYIQNCTPFILPYQSGDENYVSKGY